MESFQASSSIQGRAFEDAVETILRTNGFTIIARRFPDPLSHEEIDLVVDTPEGVRVWIESKGSWNTGKKDMPGLRRSDTAKKAVATAWHLRFAHGLRVPPYLLVTSHMPKAGSYSAALIEDAVADGLFDDAITVTDLPAWLSRFRESAAGRLPVTGTDQDGGR